MQNSEIFFENQAVRIEIDATGAVWFCAKDVCDILGYSNGRDAVARHCWEVNVGNHDAHNSLGYKRETSFVNEPGLYQLIFGSTKPVALVFQKWVFEEVIPSIRRSGSYVVTPERLAAVPFMAEIRARMEQIEKDFAFVPGAELKTVHEGLRRDRSPFGRLLWSLGTKTRKYTELCHRVATGTFNGPLWTLDRLEHNIKMLKEQIELQSARGVA